MRDIRTWDTELEMDRERGDLRGPGGLGEQRGTMGQIICPATPNSGPGPEHNQGHGLDQGYGLRISFGHFKIAKNNNVIIITDTCCRIGRKAAILDNKSLDIVSLAVRYS